MIDSVINDQLVYCGSILTRTRKCALC